MKLLVLPLVFLVFAAPRADAAGARSSSFPLPALSKGDATACARPTPQFFKELMAKKLLELPESQFTKKRRVCTTDCDRDAATCYELCDLNPPGGRDECYYNCFWEHEMCYCSCGISGSCH
ncbi:MAG TPA: hypothetical protein VHK90_18200 [Thermoanaerobaculia bacterium]|nr:hypothetical protein [Thermoanaerobaculia bacterium]